MSIDGYHNPIIPGFYPDPSICRVGGEFFLATSSFTYFPGVPIFRSTDLVEWQQIGNVLDRPTQLDLSGTNTYSSAGVCAPTLRHHDGRFWMITTVVAPEAANVFDNYFVTADDPAGPWSDPVHLDLDGIDPDLAWDDDGNCWVHYGFGSIFRCRIDDRTGEVLEGPEQTWSGTGLQFPEAPHLLRRGDHWYLLIAEGGTERGHAVSIARGPSPTGPWESCPANPIVSHRSTDRPLQNTGHADLVEAVDGTWWMVLHAVRPKGGTPYFHVLGRETCLLPIEWADGWPVPADLALEMPLGPSRRTPVPPAPTRDDFDAPTLGPAWVSLRAPLDGLSLTENPGSLTLHGGAVGLDDTYPTFVGRRQTHQASRTRAILEIDGAGEAGVAVRMDEQHHYAVFVAGDEIGVRARIGPLSEVVARHPRPGGAVVLGIDTTPAASEPDVLHLGFEAPDGRFQVLAELPGRYLSTEVATGFTGRIVGIYATATTARFDWFELGEFTTVTTDEPGASS